MISVSSIILTPMLRRKACVKASVFDISKEKISDPASVVNGVSGPNACRCSKRDNACLGRENERTGTRADIHEGEAGLPSTGVGERGATVIYMQYAKTISAGKNRLRNAEDPFSSVSHVILTVPPW